MTFPSRWSFLAFELNSALDDGRRLPIEPTRLAFESGRGLDYLDEELGEDIDTSIFTDNDRREANEFLKSLSLAMGAGRDRRKFGVEHDGICLALAYCIEAIQQTFPAPARATR